METKLTFEHFGISWLVECDTNDEWEIENIYAVKAWDEKARKYVPIPCDLAEFEEQAQDFLIDAIENEKIAVAEEVADMKFEQRREEKLCGL